MEPFEYRRAADSGEALALLAEGREESYLFAGGTDLVPLMKDEVIHPSRLVDIKRVADIDRGIQVTDRGISIGALTTLAEIAADPLLAERVPLLGEAARSAATPQLRQMATVAGNLLQRPRCWYYRNPRFHCWLAGGDDCPARDGRNDRHAIFAGASPCVAVHPSDLAPCLIAVDAAVRLRGRDGQERVLPAEDLFRAPEPERRTETALHDELVVAVQIPELATGARTGYAKAAARRSWSFALSSVAARLDLLDGRIRDARIVLGGVATVPWRSRAAEDVLRDADPEPRVFEQAARAALGDAEPLRHNAYKVPLAYGLVVQTLRTLAAEVGAQ